ncbi:MAG: hypothetical protein DME37_07480 [Verrucomicrobia bacterium]|nr:MAG: hypothetical protein DME37_07480 [Verrucomicrobiota bacterium]
MDLSLVHSSAASDIVGLVMDRLRQDGDLETGISPNFLIRNWPPAFKEWSTSRFVMPSTRRLNSRV